MLRKTIAFTDYDGVERTETFYFNLSKAEAMEMEMEVNGGLSKHLQTIVETQDSKQIVASFKELILKSYGQKSNDGKRFVKSQELRDEFAQTEAYSNLFMELAMHADKAAEFVNGIVPESFK